MSGLFAGLVFSGLFLSGLFLFRTSTAFCGGPVTGGPVTGGPTVATFATRGRSHRQFAAINLPVAVAVKLGEIFLHAVGNFFLTELSVTVLVELLEELLGEAAVAGPSFRSTGRRPSGVTGPTLIHSITLWPSSVARAATEITGGRSHQLAGIQLPVSIFIEFLEEVAGLGQFVA